MTQTPEDPKNPYAKSFDPASAPGWNKHAADAAAPSEASAAPAPAAPTPPAPAAPPAATAPAAPAAPAQPAAWEANPYATQYHPGQGAAPAGAAAPAAPAMASAVPAPQAGALPAYPAPAAPAKRRKVWPWVLSGVGVVVVAIVAAAAILGPRLVEAVAGGFVNEDYQGEPVTAADAPANGGTMVVSSDERVAFEAPAEWVDGSSLFDSSTGSVGMPPGSEFVGVFLTADLLTSDTVPTLVVVMEGTPAGPVGATTLRTAHEGYLVGVQQGVEEQADTFWAEDSYAVTTALGLEGFRADIGATVQDTSVVASEFTFGHGDKMVFVQVMNYQGVADEEAIAAVLDTLRIDAE